MASPFNKETENFMRLVLLINEKGVEAFRESLLHFSTLKHGVRTFDDVLHDPNAKRILQNLKGPGRGKPITAQQWLFLYPGTGISVEVSQLDITLCFVLLRNICGLFQPLTSWDAPPAPTDNSLEGGLAQLKSIRNFISHSKEPRISDADFSLHFKNASDAIINIQQKLPKWSTTQEELNQFQKCSISPDLHADLSNVVLEWGQQDIDLKIGLDEVNKAVTGVKTEVSNVGEGIEEMKIAIDRNFVTLEEKLTAKILSVDGRVETISSFLMKQDGIKGIEEQRNLPSDYAIQLQTALKDYYKVEMSEIRCNPLDPDASQPIDDLYVELSVVKEGVNYAAGLDMFFTPFKHYLEIFEDTASKRKILRTLVQGIPGVGKTTLTKRLAVDWAEDRAKQLSERFENVFILTLRKVTRGQTLVDIIADQLLSQESPLVQNLKTYIENNENCLFVFDGLDEMTQNTSQDIENMIKRRYLRNSCLLITSRPSEAQHLTTTTKVDQHLKIEGFDDKNIYCFIKNFFGDNVDHMWMKPGSIGLKFYGKIWKAQLRDIAKIPLILNILCLLYRQKQTLPDNISQTYQRLQQLLCKRIKECEAENEIELDEIFEKLGKIAFEGLMNRDQLFFPKRKILEEVGEDAFKVGFIWTEKAKYELEANTQVFFLHKSFQENTAAFYLGRETDKFNDAPWEILKSKMRTLDDISTQHLFLQFCVRASQRLADRILQFLDEKFYEMEKRVEYFLHLMVKLSQGRCLSLEELERAYYYTVPRVRDGLSWGILNTEAICLNNMEEPTKGEPHAVNYIITNIIDVRIAFLENNLKPAENCFVTIENDKELDQLVHTAERVSWLKLEYPSLFTNITAELLQKLFDKNKGKMAVSINVCTAECPVLLKCLRLLKEHTNVKYTGITFTLTLKREEWERVFQLLLEIRNLVCLGFSNCDIPCTALNAIGTTLNQNANTLLQLYFYEEEAIKSHFKSLSSEIENPLSLTVLYLDYCLDSSDTDAVRHLLRKCKSIKQFRLWGCPCEISIDILQMEELRVLDMSSIDDLDIGERLDVGHVLENLDKLNNLRTVIAFECGIVDSQVQKIPLRKLPNLKHIDLKMNYIEEDIRHLDNPFSIDITVEPQIKDIPPDDEDIV